MIVFYEISWTGIGGQLCLTIWPSNLAHIVLNERTQMVTDINSYEPRRDQTVMDKTFFALLLMPDLVGYFHLKCSNFQWQKR